MKIIEIPIDEQQGKITAELIAKKFQKLGQADCEYLIMHYSNLCGYEVGSEVISGGSQLGNSVDLIILARRMISAGATNVTMIHNHIAEPSALPSENDIEMVHAVQRLCISVGLTFFDSFIISKNSWFCFNNKKEIMYEHPEN